MRKLECCLETYRQKLCNNKNIRTPYNLTDCGCCWLFLCNFCVNFRFFDSFLMQMIAFELSCGKNIHQGNIAMVSNLPAQRFLLRLANILVVLLSILEKFVVLTAVMHSCISYFVEFLVIVPCKIERTVNFLEISKIKTKN